MKYRLVSAGDICYVTIAMKHFNNLLHADWMYID